jgi:hypothetical protein
LHVLARFVAEGVDTAALRPSVKARLITNNTLGPGTTISAAAASEKASR